jgi:hypothetical protein
MSRYTEIPDGMTCDDCYFFRGRCGLARGPYGLNGDSTDCDFSPSHFILDPAQLQAQKAELTAKVAELEAENKRLVSRNDVLSQALRSARDNAKAAVAKFEAFVSEILVN